MQCYKNKKVKLSANNILLFAMLYIGDVKILLKSAIFAGNEACGRLTATIAQCLGGESTTYDSLLKQGGGKVY